MAVHKNARRGSEFADAAMGLGVEELVERYGTEWLASARRAAATPADAEDAYQRAVEKLITTPPAEEDPERIAAWMHVVVKNEALQLRRAQRQLVDGEFEAIASGLAAPVPGPEERALDAENHAFGREALRRLRPDQVRCLLLRADGFDYPEICRVTGFSYAKVNRLLSEGRKAARIRVEAIAVGHECQRIEPVLSAFVDGVVSVGVAKDVQLHLDSCGHCRATVRDYTSTPRDLAAVFPIGIAFAGDAWRDRIVEPVHRLAEFFQVKLAGGDAPVFTAKKVAAVLTVTAVTAGGGAIIQHQQGHRGHADGSAPIKQDPNLRQAPSDGSKSAGRDGSRHRDAPQGHIVNKPDVIRAVGRDRNSEPVTPLASQTAGDATGFAADPADTTPDRSAESGRSGDLAP